MTRKQKRIGFVILVVVCVALAATLVLVALKDNVTYFYSPSEISSVSPGATIRLGGMVKEGSLHPYPGTARVEFVVTDFKAEVTVTYEGLLPTLFKEGQGVVARGYFAEDGGFVATELLAKHDENYMPPEVAEALGKL